MNVLMRYYGDVAFGCFLASLYTFWPGMFSSDSVGQFSEAVSGKFTDVHPPIMAWVWGLLYHHVVQEAGVLLAFHLALFWGAVYFLGKEIGKASPWLAYLCLGVFFTPSIMSMTAMLWKDTGMTCAYLFATSLMIRCTLRNQTMGVLSVIAAFLALLYGTAVRHDALFALPMLCIIFAIGMVGKQRMREIFSLAFLLCVITFGTAQIITKNITMYQMNVREFSLLTELTHMSNRTGHLLIPPSALQELGLSYGQYQKHTKLSLDANAIRVPMLMPGNRVDIRRFQASTSKDLLSAYFTMIINYPSEYLHYRMQMMQHVLRWNMPHTFLPYVWNGGGSIAKQWVGNYFTSTRNTLWFRPWIYLLTACAVLAVAVHRLRHKKHACLENICFIFSGISYGMSHFVTLTGADFRYSYWMVASSLFGLVLLAYSFLTSRSRL